MNKARNALAIVLFVVAGFWVMTAQMCAFMNIGHPAVTLGVSGVFFVISAVVLVAGAFVGAFRPRARGAGIVLLVVSVFTAFSVIVMAMMLLTPELVDVMRQQGQDMTMMRFRLGPGVAAVAVSALVGIWLARRR